MAQKTKTSTAVKARYNAKAYDHMQFAIPKGRSQDIAAYAASVGMSVAGLMNQIIREKLGMSLEEWKRKPEEGE